MEAAVGPHHLRDGDLRLRDEALHPVDERLELLQVAPLRVLGHPRSGLGLDQQPELVEVAQERLGLALTAQRLLHRGAEDVPVLGRADLGALPVLDVHHPEHCQRLHRLAGHRPADAVLRDDLLGGGERLADANPAGDDLCREECRQLLAQALRLAKALDAPAPVTRHQHPPSSAGAERDAVAAAPATSRPASRPAT